MPIYNLIFFAPIKKKKVYYAFLCDSPIINSSISAPTKSLVSVTVVAQTVSVLGLKEEHRDTFTCHFGHFSVRFNSRKQNSLKHM